MKMNLSKIIDEIDEDETEDEIGTVDGETDESAGEIDVLQCQVSAIDDLDDKVAKYLSVSKSIGQWSSIEAAINAVMENIQKADQTLSSKAEQPSYQETSQSQEAAKPAPSTPVEAKSDTKVIEHIKQILPSLKTNLLRLTDVEKQIFLEEKVELHLLMLLSTGRMDQLFLFAEQEDEFLLDIKNPADPTIRIVTKPFLKESSRAAAGGRFIPYEPSGLSNEPGNGFRLYEFGDIFEPNNFWGKRKTLLELYAEAKGLSKIKALIRLMRHFKISDDPYSPLKIDRRTHWRQTSGDREIALSKIPNACYFIGPLNRLLFVTTIYQDSYSYSIVPHVFWKHDEKTVLYDIIHIPPMGDLPLASFDKYQHRYSVQNIYSPGPIIILTDSIFLAHDRDDSGFFWTSWYGESRTVYDVDWNWLSGKVVYYLLIRHSGLGMKAIYGTALAAYEQLKDVENISLRYISVEIAPGGSDAAVEILSPDQFLLKARGTHELKVSGSKGKKELAYQVVGLKTAVDSPVVENINYLLFPTLPEKTTTLMHTADHDEASWLVMSMAYAVATGSKLLDNSKSSRGKEDTAGQTATEAKAPTNKQRWWNTSGKPCKVLYLELKPGMMQQRLDKLKKMYGDSNGHFFLWDSVQDVPSDLSGQERQELINQYLNFAADEKSPKQTSVSLLVLDDYTLLAGDKDNDSRWQEALTWLQKLNQAGCAVLLLSQDKRHKIKAMALQSVMETKKLERANASVAVAVHLERCCDSAEQGKWLPTLELDLDAKKLAWKIVPAFGSKKELYEAVVKMAQDKGKAGCLRNNQEIADFLGLSRVRVQQILKKKKDAIIAAAAEAAAAGETPGNEQK